MKECNPNHGWLKECEQCAPEPWSTFWLRVIREGQNPFLALSKDKNSVKKTTTEMIKEFNESNNKFKVGDRVVVYSGMVVQRGIVGSLLSYTGVVVKLDDGEGTLCVSSKQCRRLVKKSNRRVWIDYKAAQNGLAQDVFLTEPVNPYDRADYTEFVEVKKK